MSDDMTIAQAKQVLRDNFIKGIECPCCGQFVKKYPRKLNAQMARGLISLYHLSKNKTYPIHIHQIFNNRHPADFAKLKYWKLIKEGKNEDSDKRTSGKWFITYKGIQFIKGEIQIPKYVDLYNDKALGFSTEMTTIKDALGNKFDYAELMGRELPLPKVVTDIMKEEDLEQVHLL